MPISPAPTAPPRTDRSEDALVAALVEDLRASAVRRRLLAGERVVDTPTLLAYVSEVHSPDANEVARARFGGPDAPDVDAAIEGAIRLFDDRPFLWWVGPDDTPADLSTRLAAHGVVFLDEIPGMAMDLAELADETAVPPPSELVIQPVVAAADIADFVSVLTQGFPEDWTDDAATEAIAAGSAAVAAEDAYREPNGVPTRWLGRVDGRPVVTTRLHTGAGVAGVYAVVTVADARRRGYGGAATRRALLAARDAGMRIATLQASAEGRGVYERIGFRERCRFRIHEWRPDPDRTATDRPPAPSSGPSPAPSEDR